jgi:hypothetical protein
MIQTQASLDRLAERLVSQGHCDMRAMERARRVSNESGQRIDAILLQLGLMTERGLAAAYAELLGARLAVPEQYPQDEPLEADRLSSRFLREVRALPIAIEGDTLVVAVADPFDPFVPAAISAATGRQVRLEVAVPIELDAAFARLYPPDAAAGTPLDTVEEAASEDDAERLKDLASEAPVIRLVNQIIARASKAVPPTSTSSPSRTGCASATATTACCTRRRRRRRGSPPPSPRASRSCLGSTSPSAGCRRTGGSSWRCAGRRSTFRVSTIPRCMGRRWCCASWTAAP